MTLRNRLLLAVGVIILVITAGGVLIVHTQQTYLISQLDD